MDKKLTVSLLLDFYGQVLTPKQYEVMDYYYNDDLSLREISEIVGITRQGVHDIIKRSELFLEELEQSLGLYSKWQNIQSELDSIKAAADKIADIDNIGAKNADIQNSCEFIKKTISDIKNNF